MHTDTITIKKDGRLPTHLLRELQIEEKKPLTVIHGKIGIIIIKHNTTLTDLLSDLLPVKRTKWNKSEYAEYLLERTK